MAIAIAMLRPVSVPRATALFAKSSRHCHRRLGCRYLVSSFSTLVAKPGPLPASAAPPSSPQTPQAPLTAAEPAGSFILSQKCIRNVAIIAHVDHGKTTLVDCLLRQSGCAATGSRVMDSNDLERERGITILSKVTLIERTDAKGLTYRINIVDTPGHADFGGEVERVLSMVDGVCLVVDATEGPQPQTRYVLGKALKAGLRPIVVLNKIDRPSARPDAVDSELLDLFLSLGASDAQLSYPLLCASAREGWASCATSTRSSKSDNSGSMAPLFEAIIKHVPPPSGDRSLPFSMLVTNIEANAYLGPCLVGKIESGEVRLGDRIHSLSREGVVVDEARVTKLFVRRGLEQLVVSEAAAGDIVSIAGASNTMIHFTVAHPSITRPIPCRELDPPTLSMFFSVNGSPLSNREGKAITTQQLYERLKKATETNPALAVSQHQLCSESSDGDEYAGEGCQVFGRGELQLGILIETLRREGLELSVSPPKVVLKKVVDEATGREETLEPIEEVVIDVPADHSGTVIEKLTRRKGELLRVKDTEEAAASRSGRDDLRMTRMVWRVPTRGLLGYPPEFKNDSRGLGVISNAFADYEPYKGPLDRGRKGALISTTLGTATAYALTELEARGTLFISPGASVYKGMVIGENSRAGDLEVNPTRTKQVTNVRAVNKDETIRLIPPKIFSLEESISYVAEDEMLEITPKSIRLAKREKKRPALHRK